MRRHKRRTLYERHRDTSSNFLQHRTHSQGGLVGVAGTLPEMNNRNDAEHQVNSRQSRCLQQTCPCP